MKRALRFVDGAILAFAATSLFSIALSQLSLGLASVVWFVTLLLRRGEERPPHPLLLPLGAFLAFNVLSALATNDVLLGLRWTRSLWLPVVFFFACVDRLRDRVRAARTIRVWIAAGGLSAAVGLEQVLILWLRPPLPMDWAWFRVRGTLSHYMTFAGLLMLVALFAAALLLFRALKRRDLWVSVSLGLCLAALLLTRTRSAWIGFAVGLTLLVFVWRRWFVLAIPLLAIVILAAAPTHVRQRALSLLDLSDVTATQRYYLWSAGSRVALDHPLLGVGPGNLRDVWEGYRHAEDPTPPWERFTHVHNNPIQIAAELGLPALVCWLWIWLAFFAHAYRMRGEIARGDRFGRAVLAGATACVAAFLVAGLFEYNFGDSEVLQALSLAMALPFALFHSRDAADSAEANLL